MKLLRYASFTTDPSGGNPAGVVLDAAGLDETAMQRVAAEVAYPETAFLVPVEPGVLTARYFSPAIEVPFCGHATIASAIALTDRDGPGAWTFRTSVGDIAVSTARAADGTVLASLVSVPARTASIDAADVDEILGSIGWARADLDAALPPRVAFGGAHHPVIAAATRARLAAVDQDSARLATLCAARDWTTVALVHRAGPDVFDARNLGPAVGIDEDPATGAAAAALGGYLRDLGAVEPPVMLTVRQGDDLGRPSRLTVRVSADPAVGVTVSGTAVPLA